MRPTPEEAFSLSVGRFIAWMLLTTLLHSPDERRLVGQFVSERPTWKKGSNRRFRWPMIPYRQCSEDLCPVLELESPVNRGRRRRVRDADHHVVCRQLRSSSRQVWITIKVDIVIARILVSYSLPCKWLNISRGDRVAVRRRRNRPAKRTQNQPHIHDATDGAIVGEFAD